MDSVLDGKLMEAQLGSSDDALANLMRERESILRILPPASRDLAPRGQQFIDWRIGAAWLSSVLCWQHPLVSLLGGGRPPFLHR